MLGHQLAQEGDAVHLRHLHVERDDVGFQVFDHLPCGKRLGRLADHLDLGIRGEDARERRAD